MRNFDRTNTIRKDTETKNLRRVILKYLKDIPTVGTRHRGVFSITGHRVYDLEQLSGDYIEIDVVFKGEVRVSVSSVQGDSWLGSDIKKNEKYRVSPRKLGSFLRISLLNDINQKLSIFGTRVRYDTAIKTIKWE
jgi:hypothetical protein